MYAFPATSCWKKRYVKCTQEINCCTNLDSSFETPRRCRSFRRRSAFSLYQQGGRPENRAEAAERDVIARGKAGERIATHSRRTVLARPDSTPVSRRSRVVAGASATGRRRWQYDSELIWPLCGRRRRPSPSSLRLSSAWLHARQASAPSRANTVFVSLPFSVSPCPYPSLCVSLYSCWWIMLASGTSHRSKLFITLYSTRSYLAKLSLARNMLLYYCLSRSGRYLS